MQRTRSHYQGAIRSNALCGTTEVLGKDQPEACDNGQYADRDKRKRGSNRQYSTQHQLGIEDHLHHSILKRSQLPSTYGDGCCYQALALIYPMVSVMGIFRQLAR
jgi:hypothetical protein